MKAIQAYFRQHRLRMVVYSMLGLATIVCMILVRLRFSQNLEDRNNYLFLIRNLFLAWVPALIAVITHGLASPRRSFLYVILPLGSVLWLIFFPNAPYLLTDFQHLRLYHDSPQLWFDVVLVIWCAFTGLFLGLASLYLMHQLVGGAFGPGVGWAFAIASILICSTGIYIGRFLRFTSWGLLRSPFGFAGDVLEQTHRTTPNPFAFVSLYAVFLIFVYLMVRFFASLVEEDEPAATKERRERRLNFNSV